MDQRDPFFLVARQAAEKAGCILMDCFGRERSGGLTLKAKNDYVTSADRKAEEAIVSLLRRRFPDHRIMAEEGSAGAFRGNFTWIIDPLDGTSNFIAGIPVFCVSIALVEDEEPILGLVYHPPLHEWFHAHAGQGSFLNGKPIRVSAEKKPADALGATGFPFRKHHLIKPYLKAFGDIVAVCQDMRRCGSAALDLAYLSCGRYGFFWEAFLQPWDFMAGRLLVEEAGGKITNFSGQVLGLCPDSVVAGNAALYATITPLIRKHFGSSHDIEKKQA